MKNHIIFFLKAVSWRFFGTLITALIVYAITHKWSLALIVSFAEIISKIVAYYIHEIIWARLQKRFA